MCYETLFASSLAVKYHIYSLEKGQGHISSIPFLELYNVGGEDTRATESLSGVSVDFSAGIMLPTKQVLVDSIKHDAIIHNRNAHNAHHDIVFRARRNDNVFNIAVSCKASFNLSSDQVIQSQLLVSKNSNLPVDLLIWLYLGKEKREQQYSGKVAFINGSGCCNRLALDMFISIKKLSSQNNS